MIFTPFHVKYFSYEISKQSAANSVEKIMSTLSDAQVDLNPHQIEAALFAFKNPLAKGVILADEVGLGKTIEAGIIVAQKWAEEKQRILIIVPANLRKQWQVELEEKFYLPSIIVEGNKSFDINDGIQITSYQYASKNAEDVKAIRWDMVVIDEAHRLRNVYKQDNVIAKNIKNATEHCFKLLLTATPLQNSLLELYGLVSFIDDLTFGDVDSFKFQFLWTKDEESSAYDDLTSRLKRVCIRTLRKQVLEYIKYTKRTAITQEFYPTTEEQELYNRISRYLRKSKLMALPNSQRYLISLILWKLLASSTFAIAGTLNTLAKRLAKMLETNSYSGIETVLTAEFEGIIDEDSSDMVQPKALSEKDRETVESELDELTKYAEFAGSIKKNAKGEALILALDKGFKKLNKLGAAKKAVIFTESRRTQEYLHNLLCERYDIIVFNGGIASSADKRADLINRFRDSAEIMIATEAAAEGVNLQFCSMVINYDLPYNPQRIEQRIGRCHRYGQKHDVVVINFLNKNNIADQRVYELLYEKFLLFDGVFGASDTILGTVEGTDFEKRIIEIYEHCRTPKEIDNSFNGLRLELEEQISSQMQSTKQKLLENFDQDVAERLKTNYDNSTSYLNKYENMLWRMTQYFLDGWADFSSEEKSFTLNGNPFGQWYTPVKQTYYFDKSANKGQRYRLNSPLARHMLEWIRDDILDNAIYSDGHYKEGDVTFNLTNHLPKISVLEKYKNKSGYLRFYRLKIEGLEAEDVLIFTGYTDDGQAIESEHVKRFFDLEGICNNENVVRDKDNPAKTIILGDVIDKLDNLFEEEKGKTLSHIEKRNTGYFESEIDKLDKWAKDIKHSLEKELRTLDTAVAEAKREYAKAIKLQDKLDFQEKIKKLETRRNELRMNIYMEQDKIDQKRNELIQQARSRLEQRVSKDKMFVVRWRIV